MPSIDDLIARSSLGTRKASAIRRTAPKHVVERVVHRATESDAGQNSPRRPHRSPEKDSSAVRIGEASRMVAAMTLLPGQFMIRSIRPIGEGGLGIVDEVEVVDSNQSHPVGTRLARKRLSARWSDDPGAQHRFEREIEILRTMDHPNIVSLEGVNLPGFERYYVMPYFKRGSLRSWLAAGGRFEDVQQVCRFVATVADALAHAHAMNFFHRDLKPENILLSDRGHPVVADWGLGQFVHLHSKVLDLTKGGPMGTHYYCSLEQWSHGRCDQTGDVYSLGVVLAELAAGRALPIAPVGSGIRHDVITGEGRLAQHFNATVRRMTAPVPASRFQSIAEVAAALRAIGTSD